MEQGKRQVMALHSWGLESRHITQCKDLTALINGAMRIYYNAT